MKRIINLKRISLILSIFLSVISCRKDQDNFYVEGQITIGSSKWTGQISNFYSEVAEAEENFTFDAAFAATFRTEKQTEFHFGASSFATETGILVDGGIHLDVLQLQHKGDLILQDISTTIDGQLWEMLSTYRVNAQKGSLPLRLAHNKQLSCTFPSEANFDSLEVSLVYGESLPNGVILSQAINGQYFENAEIFDEVEGISRPAYLTQSEQLGWFGIGRKLNFSTGSTSICVNLPEGFSNINSAVFLVFDDYWSVAKLTSNAIESQFCIDEMPVGESVRIISISEREPGNFYLDFKDFTPVEGLENMVNLHPEARPLNEIMVWLQSL